MTTYAGYELIAWQPDWNSPGTERSLALTKVRLDNQTTGFRDDAWDTTPKGERIFRYVIEGRDQVTAFRTQLIALRGRLVPCWIPTWMFDLSLTVDRASGDSSLIIEACDYTRWYAVADFGRRHLAVILPGNPHTIIPRRVTSAVDNLDGTETLTLNTTLGVAVPAASVVSFLTLCRLASDDVTVRWLDYAAAEVELPLREIPREAPVA